MTERHFGDVTEAEAAQANKGRCVLPCNHAVCPIFGTKEQVWEGVPRADGRTAYCEGCGVERTMACVRVKCGHECTICTTGLGKSWEVMLKGSTPGVCGQKHAYRNRTLSRIGGLDNHDCDIPAIRPASLPEEPFIPVLENDRGWMRHAIPEQHSWATTLKMVYPVKGNRSARQIMGVPHDHWFMMNFHVRDILLEDLWKEKERLDFWEKQRGVFTAIASVNYSVFRQYPRFNGFLNMKRSMMTYKEITEAGIPCALEWPDELPSFMDRYMMNFAERNSIWGISMNMQTYKGLSTSLVPQLRRLDQWLDPEVVIFAFGMTRMADAQMVRKLMPHRKVYCGNANVYTRSVYYDIVPGMRASKKRYSQGEVFAENCRRWRNFLDRDKAA